MLSQHHRVTILDPLVDTFDTVLIRFRGHHVRFCGCFQFGIAPGMVPMVVRVPDLGDGPAGGCGFGLDGLGIGRVDHHCFTTVRIMDEEAVIV